MLKLWQRTATGGYNGGCMVVCHCDGIVVKHMRTHETPVPKGAVSYIRGQMCAHPGCLSYVSICFCLDSLVVELAKELDALGYTQTIHQGLLDVQKHLEHPEKSWLPKEPVTKINNPVTVRKRTCE